MPAAVCVHSRMRRLSKRSAMTPPHTPKSSSGQELEGRREAERHAAAGELQHQPALGDDLHPRAGERHELTGEEQPVVADAERAEGAPGDEAEARHSASSITRSRMPAARSSVASSVGGQRPEVGGEVGVLARAAALDEALAPGVSATARDAAVVGIARPGDELQLLEPGDDARHRRGAHPLDRRQLTEGQRAESLDGRRGRRAATGSRPRSACWRRRRASRMTTSRSRAATTVSSAARPWRRRRGGSCGGGGSTIGMCLA